MIVTIGNFAKREELFSSLKKTSGGGLASEMFANQKNMQARFEGFFLDKATEQAKEYKSQSGTTYHAGRLHSVKMEQTGWFHLGRFAAALEKCDKVIQNKFIHVEKDGDSFKWSWDLNPQTVFFISFDAKGNIESITDKVAGSNATPSTDELP